MIIIILAKKLKQEIQNINMLSSLLGEQEKSIKIPNINLESLHHLIVYQIMITFFIQISSLELDIVLILRSLL